MEQVEIRTEGTCCREFRVRLDDRLRIVEVEHAGGCSGNLDALAMVLRGMEAAEVVEKFAGLRCGKKSTSCMDQLSRGLLRKLGDRFRPERDPSRFASCFLDAVDRTSSSERDLELANEALTFRSKDGRYSPSDVEQMVQNFSYLIPSICAEGPSVSYFSENFLCLSGEYVPEEWEGHLGWHQEGYVEFRDGGDGQYPVTAMLYLSGGGFRIYVPKDGNVFDPVHMEAWDDSDVIRRDDGRLELPDGSVTGGPDCGRMEEEFAREVIRHGAGA